jgi:acetylornithine deacetylase/succinyl-diaminopimelate desuccinylase-like protein
LNAVHALIGLLAAVVPRNGRLIAPLEAGIAEPTADEVAGWSDLPPGAELLADVGLRPADPRAAAEFHRRTTAAASLDVHAIEAGEIDLVKTNLPVTARATLSLRVAPGQDAAALGETLDGALSGAVPEGADLAIEALNEGEASLLDGARPAVARAVEGMEQSVGLGFTPVRVGGSIPIIACMEDVGIPALLTGFGLPDDAIHGANERIRVQHLELGVLAAAGALRALGAPGALSARASA